MKKRMLLVLLAMVTVGSCVYAEDPGRDLYKEMAAYDFAFSSGAGAWGTLLYVNEDGSFYGSYHDSDMGDMGDGYPNGTVYLCDFQGQFGEPRAVNAYTYSVPIEELRYDQNTGYEELGDGIRYIYSEPYGIEGTDELIVYLPGAPIGELPEEYLSWVRFGMLEETDTTLPFMGIYNEAKQDGFSGSLRQTILSEMDLELMDIAESALTYQDIIDSGAVSQSELNQAASALYGLWDDEINSMWQRLKERLDPAVMDALTKEQLAWIEEKEEKAAEAGAEFAGGSMQPMLEALSAAESTRLRCYELAEYFD